MQVINYYKGIFYENVKLIVNFINSAEEDGITAAEKKYEKTKKKPRLS